MSIIYVEDDELLRQTVSRRLRRWGADVVEAESGEQAVEFAKETGFTGALLDVELPGIDGVETYRRLRLLQPGLPAVVMSGSLSAGRRQSFLELGVPGHCLLNKPCLFAQLQGALQSVF